MLVQIIYSSRTPQTLTGKEMASIVSISRHNNGRAGITGALCYANDIFIQCLEGESLAVNALYQHLLKDTRHADLKIIDSKEIGKRRFQAWTMGYFSYETEIGKLFLANTKISKSEEFSMTACNLDAFFDEVATHATVVM